MSDRSEGPRELLYEEKVSEDFITSTYLRTMRKERLERGLFDLLGIYFIVAALYFLIFEFGQARAVVIAVILVLLAVLVIINSEVGHFLVRRSAYPIRVYSTGIELLASPRQSRGGSGGFIDRDGIRSARIRTKKDGSEEWFAKYPLLRLGFAERELMNRGFAELVLQLKDGTVVHSGAKPGRTLDLVVGILRERWGLEIAGAAPR